MPGASTAPFGPMSSLEYGEEDGMTTVAAKPAGNPIMTAEPGSWWLVLLGALAGDRRAHV